MTAKGAFAMTKNSRQNCLRKFSPCFPIWKMFFCPNLTSSHQCMVMVTSGVTKRCRLSWRTKSALVYMSPNAGGEGEGGSAWSLPVQLYTGAQINFGDPSPDLTYVGYLHWEDQRLPWVITDVGPPPLKGWIHSRELSIRNHENVKNFTGRAV